ncbi:MAG: DUF4384 domain-containing protein, partial [Candidatus Sumerlaeota bacterium]|nr:DUF4384 domain-containing protein [Candidatus Sumerlaeota bacterium]
LTLPAGEPHGLALHTPDAENARDLFVQPDTWCAIDCRILLKLPDSEHATHVDANHVFHPGDRVRLEYRLSKPAYVYLIDVGPSGRTVLLPIGSDGATELFCMKNLWMPAPPKNWLMFDPRPGTERLYLLAAQRHLANPIAVALGLSEGHPISQPESWMHGVSPRRANPLETLFPGGGGSSGPWGGLPSDLRPKAEPDSRARDLHQVSGRADPGPYSVKMIALRKE